MAPSLDETGGGYLTWGPAGGLVVTDPDPAELAGCRPVDGVRFRLSAVRDGAALAAVSPVRVAPGTEDGELTTVSPSTGETGAGRLAIGADEMTPAQRRALGDESSAGGLWVSADGLPGSFAGLRCHRDQSNGDNLEVLRVGAADGDVFCVAYAVEATPSAVPPPAVPIPIPVPAPAAVAVPEVPPVAPPPPAVLPAPAAAVPPAAAAAVNAPSSAAQPPVLPPAAVIETNPPLTAPAPIAAVTPSTPPLAPATNPTASIGLIPAGPPRTIEQSPEEEAALGPASSPRMEIVVEVGGVTRGSRSVKVESARTPWIRPVEVDLRCPGERPRILDLDVGSVPGAQVSTGPLPMGRGLDACLIGLAEDGVDGQAGLVRVQWGDTVLSEGQYTRIEPRGGGTQTLRVQVTYGSVEGGEADEAALEPGPDAGSNRLHPVLLLSLGGLAIGGLAAAAAASWRGRRTA